MQWYCAIDGRQQGPLTRDALAAMARDGRLKRGDMVWNETLGESWREAASVEGLFDAPGGPPPLPPSLRRPPHRDAAAGPRGLSCMAPIGTAWNGMKAILFQPFSLSKWFVLGFSAWLATLGEQGTGGSFGGGNTSGLSDGFANSDAPDFAGMLREGLATAQSFIREYIDTIMLVGAAVMALVLALALFFMWLRARGKFMFLDNVVNDRAEVGYPWRLFRQHGNSLFLWTLGYGLICLAIVLALAAAAVFGVALPLLSAGRMTGGIWTAIMLIGLVFLLYAVVTGYIGVFLESFIIPIMYKEDLTATEAWGRFLKLLGGRFGAFLLYGLVYWLLATLMMLGAFILGLLACCIGACLMLLPYIGAVVLLPVTVFLRLYSLAYLEQFGAAYIMPRDAGDERGDRAPPPDEVVV